MTKKYVMSPWEGSYEEGFKVTFRFVDEFTQPKAILTPMTEYDLGVVRAFRIITIDDIKPGMTLLDTTTGAERVVDSVSTTVKSDGSPKSVRIKFTDGKYAGLSYTHYKEHKYDRWLNTSVVDAVNCAQTRFKEAYDLNVNATIRGFVEKAIEGLQIQAHDTKTVPDSSPLEPVPYEAKKRRWFR